MSAGRAGEKRSEAMQKKNSDNLSSIQENHKAGGSLFDESLEEMPKIQ